MVNHSHWMALAILILFFTIQVKLKLAQEDMYTIQSLKIIMYLILFSVKRTRQLFHGRSDVLLGKIFNTFLL